MCMHACINISMFTSRFREKFTVYLEKVIQLHSWRYILLISQNYFSLVLYLISISSTFPPYVSVFIHTLYQIPYLEKMM